VQFARSATRGRISFMVFENATVIRESLLYILQPPERIQANSHIACRAPAVLCHVLENSREMGHGQSTARARHGMCDLALSVY
jgi:hypothetical protein